MNKKRRLNMSLFFVDAKFIYLVVFWLFGLSRLYFLFFGVLFVFLFYDCCFLFSLLFVEPVASTLEALALVSSWQGKEPAPAGSHNQTTRETDKT